jgi:hypothetical protein
VTGPGVVARRWRAFADELGYPVQPGASAAAVAVLVAESHALLGGAPPPEFLDLLRDQDGGDVNGLRFYATRDTPLAGGCGAVLPGLVQVNLDMREGGGLDGYVVLADGSIGLRALHLASRAFHELDPITVEVVGVYPSFAALLTAAIDAHR